MLNLKEFGFSKYALTKNGDVYGYRLRRFLTGWVGTSGYRIVGLTNDSGEHKQVILHRLAAIVYIGDPPRENYVVNHLNGNKLDNRVDNLEWCTPSKNNLHAHKVGLNKGKNFNQNCSIEKSSFISDAYNESLPVGVTEEDVHLVCKMIEDGYRDVDISRVTAFNRRWINSVRHRESTEFCNNISKLYTYSFVKEERSSIDTVVKICEMLQDGIGVLEIARQLNINRKTVGNIKNRKTFKDLSKGYVW